METSKPMSERRPLDGIDVVVLAGGLGTRVAGILGETPKVLAPVGSSCFLDCLLRDLARLGAGRVILSLGHLAPAVISHLQSIPQPVAVDWCVEDRPLGTAGALALARAQLSSDPVLVMNGDTWLQADYAQFLDHHRRLQAQASLLCVAVPDIGRYGAVQIDQVGWIDGFTEKGGQGSGWINGGAMLLSRQLLSSLPAEGSLERDVLAVLGPKQLAGYAAASATFIDIGTPETLAQAESVILASIAE